MKAIILAAGRGERMRPLTDRCPKPLLMVRGRALIDWHLINLAEAGVSEVVINTAWLETQIVAHVGNGQRFGLRVQYSMEGRDHGGALETAGGLKKALPLLRSTDSNDTNGRNPPFWYVAADVFAPEFCFANAPVPSFQARELLAQLWMVPNPPQHPGGDFGLGDGQASGLATPSAHGARRTWSGIGLFSPAFVDELMSDLAPGTKAPLRPYLDGAMARQRLGAVAYDGPWADVGTPERLQALQGD